MRHDCTCGRRAEYYALDPDTSKPCWLCDYCETAVAVRRGWRCVSDRHYRELKARLRAEGKLTAEV